MAGWFGLTWSNETLNFLLRGTPISIGANLWLRLLVAPSSRSGGGTETTYAGYARFQLPRDSTIFTSAASGGQISNSVIVAFPTATDAGNGNLVWFDIVDTPSGAFSKLYPGGPISPAKAIAVGKPPKFRVGALLITT